MKLFRILLLTIFAYTLTSCGGAEERKAVYLEKAKASMDVGDLDKARIELKNVLQIDPKDGKARHYLGKVLEQQKEYRKAFAQYLKAEELSPELLENHARIGRFYLILLNDIEKAQEKVDFILTKDAENADGLLLSAAIAVRNKDNDKAIKVVESILVDDPKHVDSIMFLAVLHVKAEKFNDAIDLLDTAIKNEKNNEEFNKLLASALMSNKDYDRAELLYKDFLERNPDSRSSFNNLASFYHATGDFSRAEEIFHASYENKPDDIERQSMLIKYIRTKKGDAEAISELKSLITKHSNQGGLRTALGEMYIISGDKELAIETYKKTVVDFSDQATGVTARTALAYIYISGKENDKASAIIEDAMSVSPNDPDVNFLNAKFAILNKDYEKAIISLRIVTKETPENIEAFILLAKIYKSEGNDEQVKATLNSAYNNNRSNADALLVLSKLYLLNDLKQSEKIIDDYNSLKEDDYEGLSIKAAILNKTKRQDGAFDIAEKLIELFPNKSSGYLQAVPFYGLSSDTEKAIAVLEKGYLNAEDNRNILLVLTSVQAAKQPDIVTNRISAELKVTPDDDELKLLLAKVYLSEKKIDKSLPLLTEIVDGNSTLEEPYLLLSEIYQNKKDLNAIKSVLLKGATNAKSSVKISLKLASYHEFENDHQKAIEVYKAANKMHPDHAVVVNNLASLLSDYGNGESDLELAKTLALKLEKSDQPVFLDTVGWVYYKLGDSEKAVQFLNRVIEKEPNINVFNYHIGMAYIMDGNKEQAKIYLEKTLNNDKPFKQKEQVEAALKEL